MASSNERNTSARRANNGYSTRHRSNGNTARPEYISGSAVRKIQEVPVYAPEREQRRRNSQSDRQRRQRQAAAQRNRQKAKSIDRGVIILMTIAIVAIMFFCVQYLQLQTKITQQKQNVAALESELTELRENNDEYYSQVTSGIDLNEIRQIAIGKLGMQYPTEDQMEEYETEGKSYVRQYQDISESN